MTPFAIPEPTLIIAGRKFWRRRVIREAVAAAAGEPMPPIQSDDEMLLQARELRAWFGGVSDMFLWRHTRRAAQNSTAG